MSNKEYTIKGLSKAQNTLLEKTLGNGGTQHVRGAAGKSAYKLAEFGFGKVEPELVGYNFIMDLSVFGSLFDVIEEKDLPWATYISAKLSEQALANAEASKKEWADRCEQNRIADKARTDAMMERIKKQREQA